MSRSILPTPSCAARLHCSKPADAKPPKARMNATALAQLGVGEGGQVRVRKGSGETLLTAALDSGVPAGVVRIAAAHPSTSGLEGLFGPMTVERA